jgi:hypothetical protein
MAHFAKLDDNNIVIDVNVVNNAVLDSADEEGSGIAFLTEWSGGYSNWKQTSYNEKFRYNFAGIGFTYDPIDDAFIAPMPNCGHDELTLTEQKRWECSHEAHTQAL